MDMMMSQKEAKRAQIMELLTAGKIDQMVGKCGQEATDYIADPFNNRVRHSRRIARGWQVTFSAGCLTQGHYAAVTKSNDIPALINAINAIGSPQSRAAILFCLYTALRHGVVVGARWDEFDLGAMEWHNPRFAHENGQRPYHADPFANVATAGQATWDHG